MEAIIKRARAEVLAAFLAKVDAFIAGCQRVAWDKRPLTAGEMKELLEGYKKQFYALQPAAKALKDLLREARINELKDWPELCNGDHSNSDRHCMYHKRIAELEKAGTPEGAGAMSRERVDCMECGARREPTGTVTIGATVHAVYVCKNKACAQRGRSFTVPSMATAYRKMLEES